MPKPVERDYDPETTEIHPVMVRGARRAARRSQGDGGRGRAFGGSGKLFLGLALLEVHDRDAVGLREPVGGPHVGVADLPRAADDGYG
jgi:hypothetical protein